VRAQPAAVALPDAPGAIDNSGCVQPVPTLSVSEVNGRFTKVEAFLTHKIELKTVHKPYSGRGPRICGLTAGEKFDMFVQNGSEFRTFDGSEPLFGESLLSCCNSTLRSVLGYAGEL
jgi:hypothetical protein